MNSIGVNVVKKLINEQFPEWSKLEIRPVKNSGHDNRTFHLGDDMSVRLPSAEAYVPQVEKEHNWLPKLSKKLSLPISTPLAKGNPSKEYPFPWTVNKWLEGETLNLKNINDLSQLAKDLGAFLIEFQSIDASGGPLAGTHNFYRGGDVAVYDQEARDAIEQNKDKLNVSLLNEIWELALDSKWVAKPVWVHGDIAPGNILVKDGKLFAIIDFGILGVGDPACDAAMAWTFFDDTSRKVFKNTLNMDEGTWNRARGWALWKALITYNSNRNSNKVKAEESYNVIKIIEQDYELEKARNKLNQNTPTLETKRLILRQFTENDIEALFDIYKDEEVNVYLPWFPLKSLKEAEMFFYEKYTKAYKLDKGYRYAICLKTDNVPIGYVNISMENSHDLGYGLRKEFWHKGIVTEASKEVVEQVKKDGLLYVTATHDVKNPRSGQVMKQLGMSYKYSFEEQWQPKDILVTFRMYQLNLDGQEDRVYKEYWDNSEVHFIEKDV